VFVDDFDAEFDNLWSRAYGVGYVVLGDRGESEDIAQETLARALVRWKKVSAYAEPWVVRVAGNLAIDRVRQRQRTRGLPAHDLPEVDAQRVDLQRALLTLSPKQREVVMLRYLVDLPELEVAQTLGCSVGTVKTHASRGLAALRKSLEVAP
jgi:RNA polymerase sigma factor (sigma-70 family)